MVRNLIGETVLVTGGAGFIGSHIFEHLMDLNANVRILDDLSNGSRAHLRERRNRAQFHFISGDIRDAKSVGEATKRVSVVFHEAAKVSVPASIIYPVTVMDVNVMGTSILLDACRRNDVEKIVIASSSSVYGNTPFLPKTETMQTVPISPYGVSKLAQEKMGFAFYSTYGMDVTSLRYFNVYGPRQRSGSYAGVMALFIKSAHEGKPLKIEGDGFQTRDFTYVEDVVKCNILAATTEKAKGGIYNVGSGSRISIYDLAETIIDMMGSSSEIIHTPARDGDIRDSIAGLDSAAKDLGYRPEYTLNKGLPPTIEWTVEHLDH